MPDHSPAVASPARRDALRLIAALPLLALVSGQARAEVSIRYAEIVTADGGYVVNADIDLELNARLVEALTRGVALHFTTEFVIERPRWYWFDANLVQRSLNFRVSYHAITRNYRLSVGTLHQNFDTLDEALATMLRVRNWHIVNIDGLESGVSYHAAIRFRHDTSMLPKPFQVTAIGNRDWNLATDWTRWTFLAGVVR